MNSNEKRTYLPSCWEDEVRMNAMFTTFRRRDLNPNGWHQKMNFWTNCILKFCQATNKVSITSSEIAESFQRNKLQPKCINDVIDNMLKEGIVIPAAQFKFDDSSSSWLGWGYNIFKKPVLASYSLVKNMLPTSNDNQEIPEARYVVLDVLKSVTGLVIARQKALARHCEIEDVIELNDFKNHVSDICSSEDFEFILTQLRRENEVLVMYEEGECFLKFKTNDMGVIQPITEVDKAIVKLRKASDFVYNEIEALENEMGKCIDEAKQFLKAGNKVKASICVRRKKRIEIALKKKTISGENLENLMLQLKSTGSQKLVLEAYNAGVDAMKSRVKEDYNIDKVDQIMSDLEEAVGDVSEISAIMSKSHHDDTSDLEAELDELLAKDSLPAAQSPQRSADDMHEELMQRLLSLKVPNNSPEKDRMRVKMF